MPHHSVMCWAVVSSGAVQGSWSRAPPICCSCCCCCRIRVTNQRDHPIKVLGRHWVIKREDGKLEAVVQKSPDNGIVGEIVPMPIC
jgi:hypothetical protein